MESGTNGQTDSDFDTDREHASMSIRVILLLTLLRLEFLMSRAFYRTDDNLGSALPCLYPVHVTDEDLRSALRFAYTSCV